jgi:D-beta-D-heptose 7-phosphate kinase/D-beta-D-heptose 1-phosphate adenosyltransferase
MKPPSLARIRSLLSAARKARVLVVGDVMLDQFIWGRVARISPEAPVPVVEFERENFMPGGAANVARNLTALGARAELFGATGHDAAARQLQGLLALERVGCGGLIPVASRMTTKKIRVIAHHQHVARVDRETRDPLDARASARLLKAVAEAVPGADAVIVGDYGKGVVSQPLLDGIRDLCRKRGVWLSVDPKPVHKLDMHGVSLLTPNRKEAFAIARVAETAHAADPLRDPPLLEVAAKLLADLKPALLLITLGEHGMLLCGRAQKPFHIRTVAREVFDVSGAGDTVIASFTLAIASGASPTEAAILSNHAAGVVVGKVGTATVTPDELLRSFRKEA